MTRVVKRKSGKHTYLYELTSYLDENGKTVNVRRRVGRVDPKTGQEVFHREYFERSGRAEKQEDSNEETRYGVEDVRNATTKTYGVNYFLNNIADSIGLSETLKSCLPRLRERIMALACYVAATAEPMALFDFWLNANTCVDAEGLSSRTIKKFLMSFTERDTISFYEKWAKKISSSELLALDMTADSSYSEFLGIIPLMYGEDDEKRPKENIYLVVDEKSRLPVFQMTYDGAPNDAIALKTSLAAQLGHKSSNMAIIPDKGFANKTNIDSLLKDADKTRFMIPIPLTMKFAKDLVKNEKNGIDPPENAMAIGNGGLYAVTLNKLWNNKHEIHAHIFYNADLTRGLWNKFHASASLLKDMVLSGQCDERHYPEIKKYLTINKTSGNKSGLTVKIKEDVMKKNLADSGWGWMVSVGNFIRDPKEALRTYRSKRVMEEALERSEYFIGPETNKQPNKTFMNNTRFVSFISLILIAEIDNVMTKTGLREKWNVWDLLMILKGCQIMRIKGDTISTPLTPDQKEIFSAFGFQIPEW
ncbi:MAG: hypothetical protein LBF41_01695 [Deltaproteobacteria bacterium]|jgi:transposase|nr:hypothetical protein [Deltaproteobacteria bacterium]